MTTSLAAPGAERTQHERTEDGNDGLALVVAGGLALVGVLWLGAREAGDQGHPLLPDGMVVKRLSGSDYMTYVVDKGLCRPIPGGVPSTLMPVTIVDSLVVAACGLGDPVSSPPSTALAATVPGITRPALETDENAWHLGEGISTVFGAARAIYGDLHLAPALVAANNGPSGFTSRAWVIGPPRGAARHLVETVRRTAPQLGDNVVRELDGLTLKPPAPLAVRGSAFVARG